MVVTMIVIVVMRMAVAVAVLRATGQQPGAGDIDRKAEGGNRDRLVEADLHRLEQARDGFIADQEGNHRENDGA